MFGIPHVPIGLTVFRCGFRYSETGRVGWLNFREKGRGPASVTVVNFHIQIPPQPLEIKYLSVKV